jgi:hypothetical protein
MRPYLGKLRGYEIFKILSEIHIGLHPKRSVKIIAWRREALYVF